LVTKIKKPKIKKKDGKINSPPKGLKNCKERGVEEDLLLFHFLNLFFKLCKNGPKPPLALIFPAMK